MLNSMLIVQPTCEPFTAQGVKAVSVYDVSQETGACDNELDD